MSDRSGDARLYRIEKIGLALFALIVLAFGVLIEIRSAFLQFRHSDLTVYTHAGWAVRNGEDIYTTQIENGLHYIYPSPFAIAMVPFAEALPGRTGPGVYLPFAVSVGLWF